MDKNELVDLVIGTLEDKKGQDVVSLEVSQLTPMTDYMVIVTGRSSTHIKSLADDVIVAVKQAGEPIRGTEGREQSEWVLVDLGSVLVHIMLAATRSHYSLEDLWNFKPDPVSED